MMRQDHCWGVLKVRGQTVQPLLRKREIVKLRSLMRTSLCRTSALQSLPEEERTNNITVIHTVHISSSTLADAVHYDKINLKL